jgi:hypothetical protein
LPPLGFYQNSEANITALCVGTHKSENPRVCGKVWGFHTFEEYQTRHIRTT